MSENSLAEGLTEHFTPEQLKKLSSAVVGIAGAGGLGSNVAVHLVRSGIGKLVVVDFDEVAASNLNRQFYFADQVGCKKVEALAENLKRIKPDLSIEPVDQCLDAATVQGVFEHCTVIVEALDDAADKRMLAEAFAAEDRLLVSVSGIGGWGNSDRIRTRRMADRFVLVGDGTTEINAKAPATSAIVGLAAAKQADAVIEHILYGTS